MLLGQFFYCKGYSIKTRIVTVLLLLFQNRLLHCKGYSIKTRIVTRTHTSLFLPTFIAKVILLKQGLWLILIKMREGRVCIAKVILLKQGLWLFIFLPLSPLFHHCKGYSIKTRIVTALLSSIASRALILQRLFY